ncbi:uncharacterized protein MONBRDRAFT_7390 [Monosiga brevicollis MX1]|uniref:Uncharacterized protein n=1 Tax=Monosiga brevicollis TaxID=81824 RepID=A9UWT9_MONBE|nr:uncharacterized protein MONBRDRAFT_7390 [Monosiga brevicollis MX1]EDQ90274.1 predicted protein [Monosiga brevicollis MX1]|eukprot:XP_001745041.1 hypothetical protein [Monosiga brevicollis MX1]
MATKATTAPGTPRLVSVPPSSLTVFSMIETGFSSSPLWWLPSGRRGSFNPFLADDAHDHDVCYTELASTRSSMRRVMDDSETEAEGNTVDARTKELVAEVQELNGQLAELRDAKEQMQAQIDQLQADKNEATSKLKAAQEERDELLAQAAVASEGSSSGDKEREKLQDELQATKSQLEQAKEAIEILKKAQHESHADLRIKELELQSAKFEKLAKANKKGKLKAEEQVEALTQEVERLKQDLAAASTSAASAPAPSADSDAQDALASLQESYEMLQEDHEALQIKCTALEAQLAEQTANPASDNGDEDIRRLQDELADQQAKHTQETEALQAQLKAALNRAAELELHEKVEAAEHRAAAPAPPKAKAKAESKLTKEEPKKQAQKEAPEESSKDEPKKISKGEVTEDNGASTSKPGLFTRLRATARKPPAKPVEKPEEEVNPIAFARASLRRRQPRESAQSAQPAVVEEQEDEARNLKPSDMIRRQQGEASPSPQAAPGSPGVQRKQQVTFSTPPPERKTASPPPELAEDADAEPKIVKSAEAPESSLRPKASGLRRNRPMSVRLGEYVGPRLYRIKDARMRGKATKSLFSKNKQTRLTLRCLFQPLTDDGQANDAKVLVVFQPRIALIGIVVPFSRECWNPRSLCLNANSQDGLETATTTNLCRLR